MQEAVYLPLQRPSTYPSILQQRVMISRTSVIVSIISIVYPQISRLILLRFLMNLKIMAKLIILDTFSAHSLTKANCFRINQAKQK